MHGGRPRGNAQGQLRQIQENTFYLTSPFDLLGMAGIQYCFVPPYSVPNVSSSFCLRFPFCLVQGFESFGVSGTTHEQRSCHD